MTDTDLRTSRPVSVPAARGAAWLFEGFNLIQKDWLAWIGVTIIFFLLSTVIPAFIPLGTLLSNLFVFTFAGGLMLGCNEIDRGGELTVGHLFSAFSDNLGQYILLGVIYMVGVAVILLLTGILLYILLGGTNFITDIRAGEFDKLSQYTVSILLAVLVALMVYLPLLMALWFAPALIALGRVNAVEALKLSFSACMINVSPYFVYGLIGLVLSILASIPLGLGWLILFPMTVASIYLSYRDIFESSTDAAVSATNH